MKNTSGKKIMKAIKKYSRSYPDVFVKIVDLFDSVVEYLDDRTDSPVALLVSENKSASASL